MERDYDAIIAALVASKQVIQKEQGYAVEVRRISEEEALSAFSGCQLSSLFLYEKEIALDRELLVEMIERALYEGSCRRHISTYIGCKVFSLPQMDDEGFPMGTHTDIYRQDEIVLTIREGKPDLQCVFKKHR